ncbi:MAG: TetR/AcrR family transcriptional regulator [Burkholderiales bacterium]
MQTKTQTAKQPDITRDKLLEAAFNEIHRYGFQAASLTSILANTGLTKGALYHHFPSKQDLGLAVVDEVIERMLAETIFTPLRESPHPIKTLQDILRGKRAKPNVVELGCPLNNLMQEMSPLDEQFRQRLNALMQRWQDALADALLRAQKQGQVRKEINCAMAALFIISAWEGCVGIAKNMQSTKTYQQCFDQLIDYVASLGA